MQKRAKSAAKKGSPGKTPASKQKPVGRPGEGAGGKPSLRGRALLLVQASEAAAAARLARRGPAGENAAAAAALSQKLCERWSARPYAHTHAWAVPFLVALRRSPTVLDALEEAGVARRTAYDLREASKEFAADWQDAWEDRGDLLVRQYVNAGLKGLEKPVYQGGVRVDEGDVREYHLEPLRRAASDTHPELRDKVDATVNHRSFVAELPARAENMESFGAALAGVLTRQALGDKTVVTGPGGAGAS